MSEYKKMIHRHECTGNFGAGVVIRRFWKHPWLMAVSSTGEDDERGVSSSAKVVVHGIAYCPFCGERLEEEL